MTTFFDIYFYAYFLFFIIGLFFAVFIPGDVFVKKLKLSFLQRLVLSIVVGIVLLSLQGFILGLLQLRWVSYLYVLIFTIVWFKDNYIDFIKNIRIIKLNKGDSITISLLVLGTFVLLVTSWMNGIRFSNGIYFCCGLPDTVFHTALTQRLTYEFLPQEPGVAGVTIHNYHFLTNLFNAELIRLFRLPVLFVMYPYMTVFFSLLFGLSAIVFAQLLKIDKKYIYWLLFFLYFSGDITYLLFVFLGKGLNFSVPFMENAAWLWISPARVYSAVIFFGCLSLLILYDKQKKLWLGALLGIVIGSLIGFKVYVAIFAYFGLFCLSIYWFFKYRHFKSFIPLCIAIGIGTLLYLPVNTNAGGLIFTGFWRLENFVSHFPFELSRLELERLIYLQDKKWLKVGFYELLFFILYMVFVFGTIILGLAQSKKSLSLLPKTLNIFLVSGIGLSLFLGLFFIQKTGGANSIQFLITVQIIAAIYAALACYYWIGKTKTLVRILLVMTVVLLTIPRVFHQVNNTIHQQITKQGIFVSNEELAALKFIKEKTPKDSVLLTDRGQGCMYITVLSNRVLYICNDAAPGDRGIDVTKRIEEQEKIFTSHDKAVIKDMLLTTGIDYIYIHRENKRQHEILQEIFQPAFRNDKIMILKM